MSAFRTINWSQATSVGAYVGPRGPRPVDAASSAPGITQFTRDSLRQQADLRCAEQARRITELLRQKEERRRLAEAANRGAIIRQLRLERHAAMVGSCGQQSATAA